MSKVHSPLTQNGNLYVPKSITDAVGAHLVSSAKEIADEAGRLKQQYATYARHMGPMDITYSGDATIDAYSVHYLPRNTLVSRVAILCCSYSQQFQLLPDELHVLDIGSGTGGVVLGLLDLFNQGAFAGTTLDILAVDQSRDALKRQIYLAKSVGRGRSRLHYAVADLSDRDAYMREVGKYAPYDWVFAANVLTELGEPEIDALIGGVIPMLSNNGILVSVEAQRDYTKKQRVRLVNMAQAQGLAVYYPCPTKECLVNWCWHWREDKFECNSVAVGSEEIIPTGVQKALWTILSKEPLSIYHALRSAKPNLRWGVVRWRPDQHQCEICGPKGARFSKDPSVYPRGTIVGFVENNGEIEIRSGWDILSGFAD